MGRLSFVFKPEIGWSEFGNVRRLADRIRRGKARPLDSREIDLLCHGLLDKTGSSGVHPVHRTTMWMLPGTKCNERLGAFRRNVECYF